MLDLALEYCLQARNDEALAWIYVIDNEVLYYNMSKLEQNKYADAMDDLFFVAETMTELRKEKCGA